MSVGSVINTFFTQCKRCVEVACTRLSSFFSIIFSPVFDLAQNLTNWRFSTTPTNSNEKTTDQVAVTYNTVILTQNQNKSSTVSRPTSSPPKPPAAAASTLQPK